MKSCSQPLTMLDLLPHRMEIQLKCRGQDNWKWLLPPQNKHCIQLIPRTAWLSLNKQDLLQCSCLEVHTWFWNYKEEKGNLEQQMHFESCLFSSILHLAHVCLLTKDSPATHKLAKPQDAAGGKRTVASSSWKKSTWFLHRRTKPQQDHDAVAWMGARLNLKSCWNLRHHVLHRSMEIWDVHFGGTCFMDRTKPEVWGVENGHGQVRAKLLEFMLETITKAWCTSQISGKLRCPLWRFFFLAKNGNWQIFLANKAGKQADQQLFDPSGIMWHPQLHSTTQFLKSSGIHNCLIHLASSGIHNFVQLHIIIITIPDSTGHCTQTSSNTVTLQVQKSIITLNWTWFATHFYTENICCKTSCISRKLYLTSRTTKNTSLMNFNLPLSSRSALDLPGLLRKVSQYLRDKQ